MTQPWFFRFGCWPFWTPRASEALGWKENVAQPNEWTMVAWAPPQKNNNTRVEWLLLVETSCMCFKSHGIKNSLTIFSFYYLSSPPYAWEASWNLQPCYSVMPWRAEAIAMMIHLEAMGQPPLQWLQVDWWTPDWKKKCIWLPWNWNRNSKFHHLFFWGGGKGRGSCHVL